MATIWVNWHSKKCNYWLFFSYFASTISEVRSVQWISCCPISNKSLLVPIMAWHRTHAPSHYLNRWCTVYWRVCVSLGLGGWARLVHIYVSNLTIISSDNGLLPGRCQAIIGTNTGIWLIGPLEINTNEILIEINSFSFKKMHLKISSAKRRVFLLDPNVLRANMIPEWHKAQQNPVHIVIHLQTACMLYKQFLLFAVHILKLHESLFPVHMFINVGFPRLINTHESILSKAGTDLSCNLGRM